ncbi:MAG: hypothetical protein C0433_17270 [Cyclobacterium sp.]|nr:hypothetical protein [Cyclobacterium sp.]
MLNFENCRKFKSLGSENFTLAIRNFFSLGRLRDNSGSLFLSSPCFMVTIFQPRKASKDLRKVQLSELKLKLSKVGFKEVLDQDFSIVSNECIWSRADLPDSIKILKT